MTAVVCSYYIKVDYICAIVHSNTGHSTPCIQHILLNIFLIRTFYYFLWFGLHVIWSMILEIKQLCGLSLYCRGRTQTCKSVSLTDWQTWPNDTIKLHDVINDVISTFADVIANHIILFSNQQIWSFKHALLHNLPQSIKHEVHTRLLHMLLWVYYFLKKYYFTALPTTVSFYDQDDNLDYRPKHIPLFKICLQNAKMVEIFIEQIDNKTFCL